MTTPRTPDALRHHADPRIRSYAEQYSVPQWRVRKYDLDQLDRMGDSPRAMILRMTQKQGGQGKYPRKTIAVRKSPKPVANVDRMMELA